MRIVISIEDIGIGHGEIHVKDASEASSGSWPSLSTSTGGSPVASGSVQASASLGTTGQLSAEALDGGAASSAPSARRFPLSPATAGEDSAPAMFVGAAAQTQPEPQSAGSAAIHDLPDD